MNPLIANNLVGDDFGKYRLFIEISMLLTTVFSFGYIQVCIKENDNLKEKNIIIYLKYTFKIIFYILITSPILYIIFNKTYFDYASSVLIILYTMLMVWVSSIRAWSIRNKKSKVFCILTLGNCLITNLALFTLYLTKQISIINVLIVVTFSCLLTILIVYKTLDFELNQLKNINVTDNNKVFMQKNKYYFSILLNTLVINIDKYSVLFILGINEFGVYSISISICLLIKVFCDSINFTLNPLVFVKKDQNTHSKNFVRNIIYLSIPLHILFIVIIFYFIKIAYNITYYNSFYYLIYISILYLMEGIYIFLYNISLKRNFVSVSNKIDSILILLMIIIVLKYFYFKDFYLFISLLILIRFLRLITFYFINQKFWLLNKSKYAFIVFILYLIIFNSLSNYYIYQ